MAHNFKVGDRVEYIQPPLGSIYTGNMIGRIGTVIQPKNSSTIHVTVNFDEATYKPERHWTTNPQNLKHYIPATEDEKLSMLLNRRITPEQFERM